MKTEDSLRLETTEARWSWEQTSPLTKVAIGLVESSKSIYPVITLEEISEDPEVVSEFNGLDLVEAVSRGIAWKLIDDSKKVGQIAGELAGLSGDDTLVESAKLIEQRAEEAGVEFVVDDLFLLWESASLRLDLNTLPAEVTE